ncbi:MAG: aminotransferase class V-fold PLP-dependent enzyme [Bacteroidales bacterium]|nr:aminotransferase class V-fold PLP-dependent enzyme [Bacteroidales bacterium]
MKRRDIIKSLTILPFAGSFLPLESALSKGTGPLEPGPDIYQSIGVEPVINCMGTFTIISGSIERPEVIETISFAARHFVQMDELAMGIGRRLAELTGAEWGMVSAGCAAGMKHVTAACVSGGNPEKLIRIPDLTGLDKTEVVIPRSSRNAYDHAIRNIGVTIITVDSLEELEKSLNSRTAMIYVMTGNDTLPGNRFAIDKIAALAKPGNIPFLVDAAAEDLTIPNVHLEAGASIVAYSGGKAMCGPQGAGLLLGRKDLLMSAWQASSPHHGTGRDNKVGKEEMMGMLAAVEAWIKRDHDEKYRTWMAYLDTVSGRVSKIKGIKTEIREPAADNLNNRSPVLMISWDSSGFNVTGPDIAEMLANTSPRIALRGTSNEEDGTSSLRVSSGQMQPGHDKIVADRIFELLSKRYPKPAEMARPSADISGRWEVDVQFFSSEGSHVFLLEQDGNWLQGSHRTEFSFREIAGTIEGDQVKLSSTERLVADSVAYIFSGTLSGDTISGQIHLGEYLNATFTAKKNEYRVSRTQVRYPKGHPLAT